MNISCAYRLVSQDLIENKSSLVPVIAWYRQLANIDQISTAIWRY